ASAQLSSTFYSTSCPLAIQAIRHVVRAAVAKEARMGASLLRLHFHDCFVNARQARCISFRDRIYNETSIDSSLATSRQSNCPSSGDGDDNLSPLDAVTCTLFDNFYFRNLVKKKGLLHSDQQLYGGGSTDSLVTTYSTNTARFFSDFAAAMVKMGNISPLTDTDGEVRLNCRKTN
ncbi:hypothetical protein BHM03_00046457, partial [Ensete ventricosum]